MKKGEDPTILSIKKGGQADDTLSDHHERVQHDRSVHQSQCDRLLFLFSYDRAEMVTNRGQSSGTLNFPCHHARTNLKLRILL